MIDDLSSFDQTDSKVNHQWNRKNHYDNFVESEIAHVLELNDKFNFNCKLKYKNLMRYKEMNNINHYRKKKIKMS